MELQYSTRDLARAAVIAAAYAALAWISNFFGLAFPAIQFRLSEALCVLPCRDRKAAIPGLAVGCLITNLLSPYGLLDLVVGTLATLLAAVWSGRCRSAWTAAVPPVVCNAVIVGCDGSHGKARLLRRVRGAVRLQRADGRHRRGCRVLPARRTAAARAGKARHRVRIPQKNGVICAEPAQITPYLLQKCPQMC